MEKKITNKNIIEQFEKVNATLLQIDKFLALLRYNKDNPVIKIVVNPFMKQNFEEFIQILTLLMDDYFYFKFINGTSKNKIKNTLELLDKYWKENEDDLFTINWLVFMEEWHCMMNYVYNIFEDKISKISLN